MNKKIYNIQKILIAFAFVLLGFSSAIAQTNMTKMQDASVPGSGATPLPGAVLELESINRGLLVPRITTSQRDLMPTLNRTDGLLIYNTTTGCFNHWSSLQVSWLSICGTPPPAVIEITPAQCSNIIVSGSYTQGIALTDSNYLNIPVTVSQPGTYTISAVTTNGYYFEKSGNFPAAGNYTILLPGVGVPNSVVPNPGDVVTISINGILRSCTTNITITPATVDYVINNCGTIDAAGTYNIGVPLNGTNTMSLTVNVITPGFWSITSNTINGYSFSGSGTFTTAGITTIEISGTGTPIAAGTNNFNLSSNALSATTCTNISVVVAPVAFTMDCSSAVINGLYTQDIAVLPSNTITLPINVISTGSTTITTNVVNGISFTTGLISLSTLGIQNITLKASGTPLISETSVLALSGTGASASCNVDIIIQSQPISYTLSCSGINVNGTYEPGLEMTSSNTMTIPVTVKYGGAYTISTDTQNGITFSAAGTFTAPGTENVVLVASGTPTTAGTFNYTLSTNSTSAGAICNTSIRFVFRRINVLGLGTGIYQPGSATASQSARAILQSSANFGPTGTVNMEGFNIVNGAANQGIALRNLINNNKIDIIVLSYTYYPSAATTDILNDFVKNKKGVLIHSQEYQPTLITGLLNKISESTSMIISNSNSTFTNPISTISDPILDGPFMDVKGRLIGGDLNTNYYVTNLPSNMKSIATKSGDSNRSFMIKHESLGYIYIGDSGWIAGNATERSTDLYPAFMTTLGIPLSKPYNGGTTVINSFLYANTMAWAVKYVIANTITTYNVN